MQITLSFAVQALRKKSGVYIFWKYLKIKQTMNGILNGGKTLVDRVLKIFLSAKYIIVKITYKKYV